MEIVWGNFLRKRLCFLGRFLVSRFLIYMKGSVLTMPINKGYLTAKTDKASDEVYTPTYAVEPIIKYLK